MASNINLAIQGAGMALMSAPGLALTQLAANGVKQIKEGKEDSVTWGIGKIVAASLPTVLITKLSSDFIMHLVEEVKKQSPQFAAELQGVQGLTWVNSFAIAIPMMTVSGLILHALQTASQKAPVQKQKTV